MIHEFQEGTSIKNLNQKYHVIKSGKIEYMNDSIERVKCNICGKTDEGISALLRSKQTGNAEPMILCQKCFSKLTKKKNILSKFIQKINMWIKDIYDPERYWIEATCSIENFKYFAEIFNGERYTCKIIGEGDQITVCAVNNISYRYKRTASFDLMDYAMKIATSHNSQVTSPIWYYFTLYDRIAIYTGNDPNFDIRSIYTTFHESDFEDVISFKYVIHTKKQAKQSKLFLCDELIKHIEKDKHN